jgi:hypothetical protein
MSETLSRTLLRVDHGGSEAWTTLFTTVVSTELEKEHRELGQRGEPNRQDDGGHDCSRPPLQLHPRCEDDGGSQDWKHKWSGAQNASRRGVTRRPTTVPAEESPEQVVGDGRSDGERET